MAQPSISTADSCRQSGGGNIEWYLIVVEYDGQGAYLAHISLLQRCKNIPELQRWTLSHSLAPSTRVLSLPPTQGCELAAVSLSHSRTHTQTGAYVTADCDRNGWKLLLPLFLSFTVYRCVPPSLFHSFWGFYLRQAGVMLDMGGPCLLLPVFNSSPSTLHLDSILLSLPAF